MAEDERTDRPRPRELEPPAGEWLFKLRDEVLGPVPSNEIIERMFTGEVDESTEISLSEGEWVVLKDVKDYHPFLFRAKAHIRAQQARAEAERAARRRKIRNIIRVAIGCFVLIVLSFVASYLIIVNKPWKGEEIMRAWASKHVPLMFVKSARAATGSDEMGDSGINIDQILIDDAPALVAIKSTGRSRRSGRTVKKSNGADAKGKKKDKGKKGDKGSDAEAKKTKTASVGKLTNEEITDIVYSRGNLRRLYACLQREIRRNPELPSNIIMEFTIANNGRVTRVRMDDVKLQGGSLHKCFEKKLSTLRFRPFAGQVRNVTMPFNINR